MKVQLSLKHLEFEFISVAKFRLLFSRARAGLSRPYLVNP